MKYFLKSRDEVKRIVIARMRTHVSEYGRFVHISQRTNVHKLNYCFISGAAW
ncbi:MAG: hypothetical protein V1720_04260 [bacterium]